MVRFSILDLGFRCANLNLQDLEVKWTLNSVGNRTVFIIIKKYVYHFEFDAINGDFGFGIGIRCAKTDIIIAIYLLVTCHPIVILCQTDALPAQ